MLVSLYVTTNCNLRCRYCYVEKSEHKDMPNEYISSVITFIKKMLALNHDDEIVINFFGGEPLLRKTFISMFIEEIEKAIKQRLKYIITTNGTLLTSSNVDFLKQNNFSISLSLDGLPEVHNEERKFSNGEGSWEVIEKNIAYTLKKLPNTMARMTFNSKTYHQLENGISFLANKGFRMIKAVPDFFDDQWNEQDVKKLEKILANIKNMYIKEMKPKGIILSLFDNEYKHCGDCLGGYKEFSIDVHGNIFPCTYSVEYPQFKLGNIFEIEKYKVPKFHIESEHRAACRGCSYFECCISGKCLFLNYKMSGKFYEPNGFFCAYQKMIYHLS